MSKPASLQGFLRTLQTAKKSHRPRTFSPFLCQQTLDLISSSSSSSSSSSAASATLPPFFSDLDLPSLRRLLSDHYIPSATCLTLFTFLLSHPASLSFKPDLLCHLTLICRLLKATNFAAAQNLIRIVAVDHIISFPFPFIADQLKNCPVKPRTVAKFFNLLLQVYSDNGLFAEALVAFDYMENHQIQVNEKTCTIHLLNLKKHGEVKMCLQFFDRMIESGVVKVSVYSLTATIDALCRAGEMKMARELVQAMQRRRGGGTVRPNVVTFNVLIAACAKRWNFEELGLVLRLMEQEGVEFNLQTYKFLIDGFTSSRKVAEAEKLITEMQNKGLRVEAHLYNLVINGYGVLGEMGRAVKVFDEMGERGVVRNSGTYWVLINGLCKVGEMEKVKRYVKEMEMEGFEVEGSLMEMAMEGFQRRGMVADVKEFEVLMAVTGPGGRRRGRRRESATG